MDEHLAINELSFSIKSTSMKELFISDLFVELRSKAYDNWKFPEDLIQHSLPAEHREVL